MSIEIARDLLGVTMALEILPEWFPDGWSRRSEFVSEIKVSDDDRRWRYQRREGDVLRLVGAVSGTEDSLAAAGLIIELLGSLPEGERAQWAPTPAALPGSTSASTSMGQTGELSATSLDERRCGLPEIEDAVDFLARNAPEPPALIENVLHQGSKMILAGSSKALKTWSLIDMGLSVAHGLKWLGFATQQGAVLYINLEIQDAFFGRRLRAVAEAKSIVIEPGRFSVMNLRGHAADLSKLLPGLLAGIGTRNYTLIIVDPIYKVLGGRDENDAGQIAGLLNDLERLAVQTGAAVVFAAHYSKGFQAGKASIDRMSGSGVFARDSDTILALTQHEEADAFSVEATLRNYPPLKPFVVRWKYPLMERDGDLDPRKLKQNAGRPKGHTSDDLLKVLGDDDMSFSAWKAAAKEAGISETTFKKLRQELVAAGRVCQCEEKGTYRRGGKGEKVV